MTSDKTLSILVSKEDVPGRNNTSRLRPSGMAGQGQSRMPQGPKGHLGLGPGPRWAATMATAVGGQFAQAHSCYICINMQSLSLVPGQELPTHPINSVKFLIISTLSRNYYKNKNVYMDTAIKHIRELLGFLAVETPASKPCKANIHKLKNGT